MNWDWRLRRASGPCRSEKARNRRGPRALPGETGLRSCVPLEPPVVEGVAVDSHVPGSLSEPEMFTPASGPCLTVWAPILARRRTNEFSRRWGRPLEPQISPNVAVRVGYVCSEVSSPRGWSFPQSAPDLARVRINTTIGPSTKPCAHLATTVFVFVSTWANIVKTDWPSSLQT